VKRVVLLTLLASALAQAAPSPQVIAEAKRRFQRANALYTDGRYTDALHLYQAAYDLVPSPDILLNIGLTKEKTFDYEGCSLALKQFLRESKDAGRREQAEERLQHCRAQTMVPVKISSLPPSSAIYLGSGAQKTPRGRTPATLSLPPGTYEISVEAPGFVAQSQKLTVEEGVHPDIDFSLDKLSSLNIEGDVAGAEVRIDGKREGTTPLKREVPAGLYKVEVSAEGHRPVERQVRVNAGDQVSLMVSLPSLMHERLLSLQAAKALPAEVSIDGAPAGGLPLEKTLAAGQHHLEVSAPGRQTLSTEVQVPEDRNLALTVHLEPTRTRTQRAVFWTLEGVAIALTASWIATGALTYSEQSDYNAHPSTTLASTGSEHAHITDGLLGASLAIGLAGAIYYLATWPKHSRTERLR
jgi:hypothetical protein